jgi:hypothetical protein
MIEQIPRLESQTGAIIAFPDETFGLIQYMSINFNLSLNERENWHV